MAITTEKVKRKREVIRAFIALSIAETLERQLSLHAQSLALQLNREALRWVPSENYHITLAFLGDIKSQDLAKLETIMDAVASHHPITTLQIDDVQWFPSVHKPRLLVATVAANSALQKLQQALVNQLRQHGFAVENRHFRPHISLARAGRQQQAKKFQLLLSDLNTDMDELVLFESKLTPKGSRYTALAAALLE
ncbi:RNA 2',3'-cyclic phosphodiesterase [Dasania marina]|uniref:RNA 2',3'-cyclic phosphodiesterase n=1 Tax=Dasania marina TaxID=471499 RepID=UPI0030DC9531